MAGAKPRAVVSVEIFEEQNQISPVFIALKLFDRAVDRSAPGSTAHEKMDQSPRQLLADIPQIHHFSRPCRVFDLEIVAVTIVSEELVILLQRFDDQEVDREPDRPAPVRVASE